MKHIKKGGCPHAYGQWCKAVRGTDKEKYKEIPAKARIVLVNALIADQGAICAYTMKRISRDDSHIEHLKPRDAFPKPLNGADLTFDNLLACYPHQEKKNGPRYGAPKKDKWWKDDGKAFVSPLEPSCEKHFRFSQNGNIEPADTRATTTIDVLGLDHPVLSEYRSRVMREFIYGKNGQDPLSQKQTTQAVESICRRASNGQFYEFCVAIRDGLANHLQYLEKLAKKKKAIRSMK